MFLFTAFFISLCFLLIPGETNIVKKSDIFFYSNQKDYSIIPSDDEFFEFLKGKASKKVESV